MKILFIYPNAGSQLGFNYGISHLSAVLKEAGHEIAWEQFKLPDTAPAVKSMAINKLPPAESL